MPNFIVIFPINSVHVVSSLAMGRVLVVRRDIILLMGTSENWREKTEKQSIQSLQATETLT